MITYTGPDWAWGMIPSFLSESDLRLAREQINERYKYGGGGGWQPMVGWNLKDSDEWGRVTIQYPGDPPQHCLGMIVLRAERIFIFRNAWVAIVQPNGSFEVARID